MDLVAILSCCEQFETYGPENAVRKMNDFEGHLHNM